MADDILITPKNKKIIVNIVIVSPTTLQTNEI